MRRRVKKWAVLQDGELCSVEPSRVEARQTIYDYSDWDTRHRWKAVRCVVTYDDGRPAKKARKR